MGLVYSFDPQQYYLGQLCKAGHKWPGTELTLRKRYVSPAGNIAPACIGCKGAKNKSWLIPFIDTEASGIPNGMRLGKLCKEEHDWKHTGLTLRDRSGKCQICEKNRKKQAVIDGYYKSWYQRNAASEREKAKIRNTIRLSDPLKREQQRESSRKCNAKRRAEQGRESQAKGLFGLMLPPGRALSIEEAAAARDLVNEGHPLEYHVLKPLIAQRVELNHLLKALVSSASGVTSISQLVANEQNRYWNENPEEALQIRNQLKTERHKWRMLVDLDYRTNYLLYHRQKSKRRKAVLKGSIGLQLRGCQVKARFAEFNNLCAYCGQGGKLHIEHVVPISQGGTHVLGNIVPACQSCNFSKAAKEVENWYCAQPFFCKKRWAKIRKVLGMTKGSPNQLALL